MYEAVLRDEYYYLEHGGEPVQTPAGAPLRTSFAALAKRLVDNLQRFGEDPSDPRSIMAFHCAMIDFSLRLPRGACERDVSIGFEQGMDWTQECPTAAPDGMFMWWGVFGPPMDSERRTAAKKWLSSLTLTQLTAVKCVGAYLESVNIPYLLATVIDRKSHRRWIKGVIKYYPYVSEAELRQVIDNFFFYFDLEAAGLQAGAHGSVERC